MARHLSSMVAYLCWVGVNDFEPALDDCFDAVMFLAERESHAVLAGLVCQECHFLLRVEVLGQEIVRQNVLYLIELLLVLW